MQRRFHSGRFALCESSHSSTALVVAVAAEAAANMAAASDAVRPHASGFPGCASIQHVTVFRQVPPAVAQLMKSMVVRGASTSHEPALLFVMLMRAFLGPTSALGPSVG
jgi:hypothetical protein